MALITKVKRRFRRNCWYSLQMVTLIPVIYLMYIYLLRDIATRKPIMIITPESKSISTIPSTQIYEIKESVYSHDDILQNVQKMVPNIPIIYWSEVKDKGFHFKNSSCAKFPSVLDILYNNMYWQTLHTSNGTMYLYGAYYDSRKLSFIDHAVRILIMMDRIQPSVVTYCQLWYQNKTEPVFVKNLEFKYLWSRTWGNYKQGILQAYIMACVIPVEYRSKRLVSVSVVEHKCDHATNNLLVDLTRPTKKKDFAVCVKGMDFAHEDVSVKLIEWLELLRILGADKVFLYQLQVHPNISKVFEYYKSQDFVDVKPLTLPGGQPNLAGLQHLYLKGKIYHKRQNEVVPYNDCYYRNMYSYNYVALLDTDEIIIPIKRATWQELVSDIEQQAREKITDAIVSSFNFRNAYFFDDTVHDHGWFKGIPKYMHMLQHVYRSGNYTKPGAFVKSFYNTERVLGLHNHFPFSCIHGNCANFAVNVTEAHLQHYRVDCVADVKKTCTESYKTHYVLDTTIWRYKDTLIERVSNTLLKLNILTDRP